MTKSRWTMALLVLSAPLLAASYWPMINDSDVASGQESFGRGDYSAAATSFRKALGGKGERARLHFDLGTALVHVAAQLSDASDRERQLDLAIASLRRASTTKQPELRKHVNYNLGNALLLRGRYDESIAAYRLVLRSNANHDDARHNLELALMAKRASESGKVALADALRKLGAAPAEGKNAGGGDGQEASEAAAAGDQTTGAEGSNDGTKPGREQELGDKSSSTEQQYSGQAGAKGEGQQGGGDAIPADLGAPPRPRSDQSMSLQQKLDALERRSGQLRRANILQKTEARVRNPDKRTRDQ